MNPAGHKHSTRWSFGDVLYHRLSGERGMVVGLQLRPSSTPVYLMVFEDEIADEKRCMEIELTESQPTAVTSEK